jgi:hypothetical protein
MGADRAEAIAVSWSCVVINCCLNDDAFQVYNEWCRDDTEDQWVASYDALPKAKYNRVSQTNW